MPRGAGHECPSGWFCARGTHTRLAARGFGSRSDLSQNRVPPDGVDRCGGDHDRFRSTSPVVSEQRSVAGGSDLLRDGYGHGTGDESDTHLGSVIGRLGTPRLPAPMCSRGRWGALGIAVFGAIANSSLSQRVGGHISATTSEIPVSILYHALHRVFLAAAVVAVLLAIAVLIMPKRSAISNTHRSHSINACCERFQIARPTIGGAMSGHAFRPRRTTTTSDPSRAMREQHQYTCCERRVSRAAVVRRRADMFFRPRATTNKAAAPARNRSERSEPSDRANRAPDDRRSDERTRFSSAKNDDDVGSSMFAPPIWRRWRNNAFPFRQIRRRRGQPSEHRSERSEQSDTARCVSSRSVHMRRWRVATILVIACLVTGCTYDRVEPGLRPAHFQGRNGTSAAFRYTE